jgi:hypothetical protein
MREKKPYTVIIFDTTSQSIAAEKYCLENGIPGRLIPVPTSISAGCGICWRMTIEEYEQHQDKLRELACAGSREVML